MNAIQFLFVNRSMRDALRDAEPHHHVHFNMQSNEFTHAFQSSNFDVEEVREGSERFNAYLVFLAKEHGYGNALSVVRSPAWIHLMSSRLFS